MARNRKRRSVRIWCQRKLVPPLLAWGGQQLLHLMLFTCRLRVTGLDHLHSAANQGGCILMLWHEHLTIILNVLLRKARRYYYAAVVSNSRDGEILAAIGRSYRHGDTIRVPHHSRHRALKEMIRYLRNETILLVTPDGPRGPVRQVKAGTAFAAKQVLCPVIPFHWRSDRYWTLPTWDKMRLPKPFSTIDVHFGPAVIAREEETVEQLTERLQQAMELAEC